MKLMNGKEVDRVVHSQKKIIQLLQWKLTDIEKVLPDISKQGFNAIQISPIQGTKTDENIWYWLYQNINLKIGNPQIGSRKELKSLCHEAKSFGIEIYADVLLHNVASNKTDSDIHPLVEPELLMYVLDMPACDDYENRFKTTHYRVGLPIVDYSNEGFQNMATKFLWELVDCGIKGFRIDMAKHFALPEEGSNFFPNVFGEFIDNGLFVYGEILDSDIGVLDMYSKYMYVLTNKTITNTNKLVKFPLESHDTYHTWKSTKDLHPNSIIYELGKLVNEGIHTVFFARPLGDEKGLTDLWKCKEVAQILNH